MKKAKSIKSNNNPKNHSPILDQISRQRLWFYRFFTMILVPVILFFLLEISLRLFHFGYPTSALIETNINGRNYIRENSAFAYRFFPKRLAREFTPLRFEADKPKDVFRIFILGGSAAQGTPDAAFSFGRILEVMLQLKYPDTKFEILPMAMPAINSHVVVEIAKDCAAYKPDLLIVYMGNNEVVGPFGPGTILTPIASNISLLRFGIRLKSTKIYQLITLTLEKMNILKSPFNQWKGMEMFLENQVRINDPGLEITYNHFNDNLEKLNQIGYENNIKIIYSTVVSNLKDCPPFNSLHRADISEAELQNWERFYSSGSAHEKAGQCRQAIKDYLKAAKVDSEYADLQYRLGHCYWESGNFTQARKHYFNAREYDTNRFRADNRINTIIRNSAVSLDGFAFLADALSEIQQKCPGGLPGNDFLLEHVHLNFEGNYQVAHTIFKQIEQIIPDRLKNIKTNNSINISDSLCAGYLAYNYYEKHHILELVLNGFIKQPPFTNQLYHLET
ncbi:MAG TPA: tetratricopeptide repeat protein, partial [Caldithrix sp.]|nr:tetratricopeptide repeat protein [Caldithrix sp.]